MSSTYPYTERFDVVRGMPSEGRSRRAILDDLATMAREEDKAWESGQCSGTMYCGDHDHYEFMADAFKLFAHVNVLQRDICPSASKFEGEIIAMTLDMLHGDAVHDSTPAGLVTSGGSDSILHAMYAYREDARQHRPYEQRRQSPCQPCLCRDSPDQQRHKARERRNERRDTEYYP